MVKILPPIMVFDGLDLQLYDSLDNALREIEGVDVEDGCYECFDAAGRRVSLGAKGVRRGWIAAKVGEAVVTEVEETPSGGERLHSLLVEYLAAIGRSQPRSADLATLIAECVSVQERDT